MPPQEDHPRILLVDDEADFRQTLAKRLTRRGLVVEEAGGGREALEKLAAREAEVVVLDVKMPEMDGLTAMGRIKDLHPAIEVILLTGQASTADGVEGMKAGAFDYLTKPVEIEHLAGKIRQAHDLIHRETEKAQEAEFRAKMEQRLIATERLASLGTLASGVAHEINNPLAIISEAAGWLKGRADREESLPEGLKDNLNLALGKIESSVERARRITHNLLSFARQRSSAVQEFDLEDLAAEVVELTKKTAAEAQAQVNVRVETTQTRLWSDPYQVRQILINLVTNGLQAVQAGGEVSLTIDGDGEEATVVVADDGPGIPPENLERIFEPFFSTKPPGAGTGLGLSVSRGLVDKLGGRIEVMSRLGEGASFKVTLPRTAPEAAEEKIETASA